MIRSRNVRRTEQVPRPYRGAAAAGFAGMRKPTFSFRNPFFTEQDRATVFANVKVRYNNWKETTTPLQWADKQGNTYNMTYAQAKFEKVTASARGAMMSSEYQDLRDRKGAQYEITPHQNSKGKTIWGVPRGEEAVKQRRQDWCEIPDDAITGPCYAKCDKRLFNRNSECLYHAGKKTARRQARIQRRAYEMQGEPQQMEEEL